MSKLFAIIAIILLGGAQPAYAINTCKQLSKTCVDTVEPKLVSGLNVRFADVNITDGCWKWETTYDCVDTSSGVTIDYCAPLDAISQCSVTNSVCSQTSSVNGSCDIYTKTYQCGTDVSVASNIVLLDTSYTLSQDSIDYAPCDTHSQNSSCKQASETCTDGPSTKVIFPGGGSRLATPDEIASGTSLDGAVKTEACWTWSRDYSCLVGNYQNYCQPLVGAGCVESSQAVCKNTGWDGSCLEYERTYNCGGKQDPLPTNVIYLNSSYTIVNDSSTTTCADAASNSNCTKMGDVCVEGPETRVVLSNSTMRPATQAEISSGISNDGAVVFKDCWKTDSTYSCASSASATSSTCGDLKADTACSETSASCIDYLADGQCGLVQHVYNCTTGPGQSQTVVDCGLQVFCADGSCFDTGHPPDSDFGKSVAYMEAIRQATEYDIFKGEPATCRGKLAQNCCKAKGGGYGGNNNVIASTLTTTTLKVAAEEIYVWGSKYVFEGLMNSGSEMLQEYAMSALTTGTLSTSANFSVWGATFQVSTSGITFVGFDPWSLVISAVIYLVMDMMQCNQDEQVLGMRRGQGLCHQVGTWCSSKVLGSCTEKKEGWCCFISKLGRIINEQGRAQIGKGWGSPEAPNCSGFTLDELSLLKFDEMDLSEFIADIVAPIKNNTYATDRLNTKAQSYYAQ